MLSLRFQRAGETVEDLEWFDPDSFISRLLGMGDLKALAEKVQESISEEEIDVNAMLSGRFTLRDMYRQLEAVNRMGPLKQVLSMLPLGGMEVPSEAVDVTSTKMERYRVIMDSMTSTELDDPTVLNGSRVQRIARGSGATLEEVRELIKYYKMMKRTFKSLKGGEKGMQRLMKKFGRFS